MKIRSLPRSLKWKKLSIIIFAMNKMEIQKTLFIPLGKSLLIGRLQAF